MQHTKIPGCFTQPYKLYDKLYSGNLEDLYLATNTNSGSSYYLPVRDIVYEVGLRSKQTFLILEDTCEFTSCQDLWSYELKQNKKGLHEYLDSCYICMPGLTIWSNYWMLANSSSCAWWVGRLIKRDNSLMLSHYPQEVQNAVVSPLWAHNL